LDSIDWKAKLFEKMAMLDDQGPKELRKVRTIVVKHGAVLMQKHYKILYEVLVAGDPKGRTIRSVYSHIGRDYHKAVHG